MKITIIFAHVGRCLHGAMSARALPMVPNRHVNAVVSLTICVGRYHQNVICSEAPANSWRLHLWYARSNQVGCGLRRPLSLVPAQRWLNQT